MTRSEIRARAEAMIEELIGILDALDGDPDLEANGDDEPWLGWTAGMGIGDRDDLEIAEADYAA